MMDRRQQNLQLVLLPPELFIPAHQDEAKRRESLEALGDSVHPFIIYQETSDIWINVSTSSTSLASLVVSHISFPSCFNQSEWHRGRCLLWSLQLRLYFKYNPTLFAFPTQVHDIFHPFIQTSDGEITFITVNESKTGFCHLYKITSVLQRGSHHWAKGYTYSEGNTTCRHTRTHLYCSCRTSLTWF